MNRAALFLLGVLPFPLGLALWFMGMAAGFGGGDPTMTYAVAVTGMTMMGVGLPLKAVLFVVVYLRGGRVPVWFWGDWMLLGVVGAVWGGIFFLDEALSSPPPPAPPPVAAPSAPAEPPASTEEVQRLEGISSLELLEDGRVRLVSSGAPLVLYDRDRLGITARLAEMPVGSYELLITEHQAAALRVEGGYCHLAFIGARDRRLWFVLIWHHRERLKHVLVPPY